MDEVEHDNELSMGGDNHELGSQKHMSGVDAAHDHMRVVKGLESKQAGVPKREQGILQGKCSLENPPRFHRTTLAWQD